MINILQSHFSVLDLAGFLETETNPKMLGSLKPRV
jgi:hypothetical protein